MKDKISSSSAPRVSILFDRAHKASSTRNGSVEIEVYHKGVRKRFLTGVNVTSKQWKNGKVVNHPDAADLNEKIETKYKETCQRIETGEDVSIMGTHVKGDPSAWMLAEIEKRRDIKDITKKQHRTAVRSFQQSGLFKRWEDITLVNIEKWDQEIRRTVRLQSSIHAYHKGIGPYIKLAVRRKLLFADPYAEFRSPKGAPSTRSYLTEEEVAKIRGLDLSDWPLGAKEAQDLFLLACYTGLSFCDLVRVSRSQIFIEGGVSYLEDKRGKTGTSYRLRLLPQALEILGRRGWNMNLLTNQAANRWLKAIASAAGVKKKVTMHVGRHTFATWALSRGVSIEVVSKMLAHTDIKTTQIYAKVLQKDVDAGFEKLL